MDTTRVTPPFTLTGKTALVTGGGSGIGRGIAELFADVGARVIVVDLDEAGASATVANIRSVGGEAEALVADVSQETAVAALFERAAGLFGKLDVLVNNAAIFPKKPFLEVDAA